MTIRLVCVATCPVWENPDGTRRPGRGLVEPEPPTVGWCNVLVVDIAGERRELLAVAA